jgi:alpha-D-ribose 1-methylphosphonate 5-triphosphate synthase subunit PhnG
MTPEELATGLAAAARVSRAELLELATWVRRQGAVVVDEEPRPATVMVVVHSPVGEFCLGEVVVTVATVRRGDRQGWGCVIGYDEDAALASALCSTAGAEGAEALARTALMREADGRRQTAVAVAATRVDP